MSLHAPQSSNLSTCGYDKFITHSPGSRLHPDSGHFSDNNQSCFKQPIEVATADYSFSIRTCVDANQHSSQVHYCGYYGGGGGVLLRAKATAEWRKQ